MDRRSFLKVSMQAAAISTLASRFEWLANPDDFTPLRGGVGIYQNRGGTIGWMASSDALVVIDTQFPETAAACLEGLKKRTSRDLDLLINTHHHGDHTAGNSVFVPAASVSVAHENVPVLQLASAERRGTTDEQVYVETTYSDEWSADVGSDTVHLMHFGAAHTGGDSIIHFRNANIAHMGDLVFNRMPPYIDRSARATVDGWITVLETAHGHMDDETIVISGHGSEKYGVTGDRSDLLVMRDYLSALREYVMSGIKNGKTADELVVEKLPGFEEHYREGSPTAVGRGIRAAFEEYSGNQTR